jgi:hypothetical protein
MSGFATSFLVDKETLASIEALKSTFGTTDSAQVVRKALGLAKLAAENADEGHSLVIVAPDGTRKRIRLAD